MIKTLRKIWSIPPKETRPLLALAAFLAPVGLGCHFAVAYINLKQGKPGFMWIFGIAMVILITAVTYMIRLGKKLGVF